jgi:hypothetical protein
MTTEEINQTALHEASHSFAALAYHIANFPRVTPDKPLMPHSTETVNGICQIEQSVTPFQNAVIGWAGILGVCMFGSPPVYAPPFKPSTLTQLRVWHDMMLAQIRNLSSTDRAMIIGYKKFWQSCKAAFLILSKNKSRVKWLAKHLAADAEKRQAESNDVFSLQIEPVKPNAPMTEIFEASLSLSSNVEVLRKFLSRMSPDDPQRPKFQKMLECLERGEKLPDETTLS